MTYQKTDPEFLKLQDSNFVKGCEAIACTPGFRFVLKSYDECNYCTVATLREMFGCCDVVKDPDGGVLATVRGTPYVWFAECPERCTCKL